MLWIETPNHKNVFHNEVHDDFIRFLPKALKCDKSEIQVWIVAEGAKPEIIEEMKKSDELVRLCVRQDDTLNITAARKMNVDGEDILDAIYVKSFAMSKATRSWPYEEKDGKLKFIGLM